MKEQIEQRLNEIVTVYSYAHAKNIEFREIRKKCLQTQISKFFQKKTNLNVDCIFF